jgi:23S rRNA pseudouridine1911/1915/1917 synthase
MEILYSDNHVYLVDKPAGLLTQPSDIEWESLEVQVKDYIKEKMNKSGEVYLHAVHRLDRIASGIVLFAKTSKALERLNAMQKAQSFVKIYIVEVEGIVEEDTMTLKHYLPHDEYRAKVAEHPFLDAKVAELSYEVMERRKNSTILKVILKTGRYHQIRAQLSYVGYPVIGDDKYGAKKTISDSIHLHHAYHSFIHPVTKEKVAVFSKPQFYPKLSLSLLGF